MTARIVRGQGTQPNTLMAADDAPVFGFDRIESQDIPIPVVFAGIATGKAYWRVAFSPHDALRAIASWTDHMLGHGMTTPAELGARLSTVPHAENLIYGMLAQMPDSMAARIFHVLRIRLKDHV